MASTAELPRAPHENADGNSPAEHGGSLNRTAAMATSHCLVGCAAGEVTGMAIARSLGWSAFSSIGLAVGLAFLFGYILTAIPLIRAGLGLGAVVTTAVASDTLSIAIMEAIDNLVVLLVPGALMAGPADPLLWLSLAAGFAVAFPFAFMVNRALVGRGRGPACAH